MISDLLNHNQKNKILIDQIIKHKINSKVASEYFTLNNSGQFLMEGLQKSTQNQQSNNEKENTLPLQQQKIDNQQKSYQQLFQASSQQEQRQSFKQSQNKIPLKASEQLPKKEQKITNFKGNRENFSKVNEMDPSMEENQLVNTFNTECPLSSERFIQNSCSSHNYQKIFIPVILENKFNSSQVKAGSYIVDLYKIESLEIQNDIFSVYTGISLNQESKNEQVTIKIYEPSFNLGLKEITNYLHLYEFNLSFHQSGICKMRDFFYYRNKLFVVTDYIGKNILNINKRFLSLNSIKTIMQKAFKIVENLYNLSIIHLNLTPQTINYYFTKQTINICISDFEHSQQIETSYTCNFDNFEYGDLRYQAPEIILGIEYTTKSDVWSLGCIMYELLTGETLFKTQDKKEIIFIIKKVFENEDDEDGCLNNDGSILNNKYIESFQTSVFMDQNNLSRDMQLSSSNHSATKKIHELNEKILEIKQNFNLLRESSLLYDFLRYLLSPNPEQRPSLEEALQHVWIQDK
ncbi:kinase domain protein (macronuclear) [Tetrahymena thermophila SB210]|uniref:Kinase domain protein n=1 Tax=Tetrahymena thermophila (strain SB210) TaxID=312017 RepID=Q22CM2_TETTS|nr:kinase domain protein [Tetrahymena thermophila SB210]EAR83030.2 kinase domain protein [Tetrahymena thermophila SB210]|eukprot:XP_001030693.2 kinase domain protein [Tetrahymena thermophila SB210]